MKGHTGEPEVWGESEVRSFKGQQLQDVRQEGMSFKWSLYNQPQPQTELRQKPSSKPEMWSGASQEPRVSTKILESKQSQLETGKGVESQEFQELGGVSPSQQ